MKTEFTLIKKQFTLTKAEFIERSMKGEVFVLNSRRYYYDVMKSNPFRLNNDAIDYNAWDNLNGKLLFTLEEPKEEPKELLWYWSVQQPDGDWEIEQYMDTETCIKQMYKNYTRLDALGSKEQEWTIIRHQNKKRY